MPVAQHMPGRFSSGKGKVGAIGEACILMDSGDDAWQTLAGDMDLNPETGQYRLSASVPGVEANDLRRTLAIRPLPFPVGGGVRGVLHVTGPLETPVFSGEARKRLCCSEAGRGRLSVNDSRLGCGSAGCN